MSEENIERKSRFISRFGEAGRAIVIRLKTGSDLLLELSEFFEQTGIRAGVILSGVGLLSRAKLRNCRSLPEEFPITDKNRSFNSFNSPLEILSMSGNISMVEESALLHSHLTLSYVDDGKIRVVGGHLIEGCIVHGFAEIIVLELNAIEMIKAYDEETKTYQLFS